MVTFDGRVRITDICLDFQIREVTEADRTSIPTNWPYKSSWGPILEKRRMFIHGALLYMRYDPIKLRSS